MQEGHADGRKGNITEQTARAKTVIVRPMLLAPLKQRSVPHTTTTTELQVSETELPANDKKSLPLIAVSSTLPDNQ